MMANPNSTTTTQMSPTDTETLRLYYEESLRTNPNNIQAVYFLGIWHLERQSYYQVISCPI
jgi:cytochrome c-type biogenesis protein CcmH/NrfG